jgi:replicative DNA helicase
MNTSKTEQALIAILMTGDTHRDLLSQLSANLFTDELTNKAFKVIEALIAKGKTPDAVNFFQYSKEVEGFAAKDMATVVNWSSILTYNEPINEYIATLKDANIKRSIGQILTEESLGMHNTSDGYTAATGIIKRLTSLLDTGGTTDNIIDLLQLTNDEREAYYRRAALTAAGKTTGVETGIQSINRFTGGWHPEFIIIAGRPSMGKTALALFHGMQSKEPGIYFNLEMNPSQLCQRLILMEAEDKIQSSRLRDGNLTQPELAAFEQTIGKIEKSPFLIYDKARCGVHEAIRVIKREHRKGRCKWVIIDYLQLMTIEGFRGGNREAEVAEISRTIKAAQKELGIPIIALAQLSREVEKRADKKPMLSDLRESGSLEQDADTVAFVWRPSYYGLNDDNGTPYTNEIFYLFEKHRQGATGTVEFRHSSNMTSFSDSGASPQGSSYLPSPPKDLRNYADNDWDNDTTNPF